MNANFLSRVSFFTFVGFAVLTSANPLHAEETKTKITPHGTAIANNGKTDIELGFEFKPKNVRFRLLGKTPFTSPAGSPSLVQFDKNTSSWRLATLLEYERDTTGITGAIQYFRIGLTGEWGISDYSYYPDAGTEKETKARQSFSAGFRSSLFYSPGKSDAYQIMPQIFFRYDRSWKAADKTGIVVPGATGQPSTVVDKITKAPSVSPLTTIRLALPYYPGWSAPLAFSPSVILGLSSKEEETFGSDLQRVRSELWFYFFPKSDSKNLRIGLAPFLDTRIKGDDSRDKQEYGGLLQLRVGVIPLEY